jgi:hypothetical protein
MKKPLLAMILGLCIPLFCLGGTGSNPTALEKQLLEALTQGGRLGILETDERASTDPFPEGTICEHGMHRPDAARSVSSLRGPLSGESQYTRR